MRNKARGTRQEARGERREVSKRREAKVRRSLSLLFVILLLLTLSFWIQGCQSPKMPQGVQVKVEQVLSGQTLEVTSLEKSTKTISSPSHSFLKVRLVGVDAPDLQQQPWGQAAKQRLEAMIGGKTVWLESDVQDKDAFGRHLAYIWLDGVLLNKQLVKEGYLLWVPRSPNHKYDTTLEKAQAWARLMGQGIWNPEQALRLTPAEFRNRGA